MKLSPRDREVILKAQLRASEPLSRLKKGLNYKEHTVRYSIQRCLETNIIAPRVFVNLNRLGFNQYEVFFTLSSDKKQSRSGLIKSLVASDYISWFGQLGGDFQYGLNMVARNIGEVVSFFADLSEQFGTVFMEKAFAERISLQYFGSKFLSSRTRPAGMLSYAATTDKVEIDDTDRRILSAVTKMGERSSRRLARELSLPQTTVDYRLRKLEEKGVIVGYYYHLQAQELGLQSFLLLVGMKSISVKAISEFNAFCARHPNVLLLIHSLGSWDFEVWIDTETAVQATAIVEQLYDAFGHELSWIKILPAFQVLKVAEYPFQV